MSTKKRLAVISTHPVQYNAPLFRLLAERKNIEIAVFYTWGPSVINGVYDHGFGKKIQWDIPLLEGYKYFFPENVAAKKGAHHFNGIDNPALTKSIKHFHADAILIYGWAFKSHLKLMRHFHGKIPVVFRGDSTLIDDSTTGYKRILRKLFLTWVYKHVDYALYTGKNNFDYFKQAGLLEKQLVYAPHSVDNERFKKNVFSTAQAVLFRQQFGVNSNEIVFLFAGKFEPKKDPLLLLTSFIQGRIYNKAHLVFVGNGQLENELKQKAKGIDNIHFMDFQNQNSMPGVYQMSDIFVLPSKGPGETWGLALNESMAAGCAVIASDKCGGAIDLIDEDKNGFIFQSGNLEDLVAKMLVMVNNPDKLASMKRESIEKIKYFNFAAIAKSIETIIN